MIRGNTYIFISPTQQRRRRNGDWMGRKICAHLRTRRSFQPRNFPHVLFLCVHNEFRKFGPFLGLWRLSVGVVNYANFDGKLIQNICGWMFIKGRIFSHNHKSHKQREFAVPFHWNWAEHKAPKVWEIPTALAHISLEFLVKNQTFWRQMTTTEEMFTFRTINAIKAYSCASRPRYRNNDTNRDKVWAPNVRFFGTCSPKTCEN